MLGAIRHPVLMLRRCLQRNSAFTSAREVPEELDTAIVGAIARVGRKDTVRLLREKADEIESWMKSARRKGVTPGFF